MPTVLGLTSAERERLLRGSIPLPIQTGLDHRGGLGSGGGSLFPPQGTFEALGGREAVARLVDGLYDRIEVDKVLRPAFNRDLMKERVMLKRFFEAWFGGDPSYFDAEWRQGLQTTHGGVSISRGFANRWLGHFFASFAAAVHDPVIASQVRPYITRLALGLINRTDEPVPGERLRDSRSGESVGRPFMPALQRDDAAGIAAAAAEHPQVIQSYGPMLLLVASARGKLKAAEALLRQGVDVNAPRILPGSEASTQNLPMLLITPLCGALARRREKIVELLARHGARYDIFTAAFVGDLEGVRGLLDLAPQLAEARDPAGDVSPITPLTHAVWAGQVEVARLLLQRGATVGVNSVRLVRVAANAGDEALTDLLLANGADASAIGAGDWVMHPALASKLLARGANVNYEPGAWIGLCCTGNSGHKENVVLAQTMLRCGADVSAIYKGNTALHCAAKAGFAHVVEALIEYGADVNALNDRGRTALDEVAEADAGTSIDKGAMRRLLMTHGARQNRHASE
jgi:ankyrin repeat protein/truncated hemoglobin YjbI